MAREINLVPDVKGEMIKALKLRNFIFFLCIVIVAASIGVSLVFFSIVSGQNAVVSGKTDTLNEMSDKINSYADLSDFLTIKDQLGNISSITSDKKMLSRTFSILSALIPNSVDTITISELRVDMEDNPTFTIDAQANAGQEPYIDYRVLDAFKKSMQYMRYDYGEYVDKEGDPIPSFCMIETGADGASLVDHEKGRYAFWTIEADGCAPASYEEQDAGDDENESESSSSTNGKIPVYSGYQTEEYNGAKVVRIWRTPQFAEWYKNEYMSLDGAISGVAHFNSACIAYEGNEEGSKISWTDSNTECLLVPDGEGGIAVSPDSSNGRDASEQLVLRFNATITLAPEVYSFSNKHMIAIGPTTRYNVTDSYVQVQNMFKKRAHDCVEGDTACEKESTNKGE